MRMQIDLSGNIAYEEIASGQDGNTLRAKIEAGVKLVPQGYIDLTFTMSNTYWNELTSSGKFDDGEDDFNMLEISAIYYIYTNDKDDSIGVQLAYEDGANPEKGREDQSSVTFGFVFSL